MYFVLSVQIFVHVLVLHWKYVYKTNGNLKRVALFSESIAPLPGLILLNVEKWFAFLSYCTCISLLQPLLYALHLKCL